MPKSPYALADLYGIPRSITLAGESFNVAPLRVRDLADLGAFAMNRQTGPDPIDVARFLPEDTPPDERSAAFRAAQDHATNPPPDIGTPGYRDAFATAEGSAFLIYVVLHRHNDGFSLSKAMQLLGSLAESDPDGMGRLCRRAFGSHPVRDFMALIDPEPSGEPPDWPRLIATLAEARGWTFDQIGDMTLPAFWIAHRKGKAPEIEYRPRRGESMSGLRKRIRSMLGLS